MLWYVITILLSSGAQRAQAQVSGPSCSSYVTKTTANGLGNNFVYGVYVVGSTVYAATRDGLSISTDGGNNFINKTSDNGLGSYIVYGVYAVGSTVYAATLGGLSISTDGGSTFTNRTTANGLGNNLVSGVYAVSNMVYAATRFGLGISTDGGNSFTNKTTANGLGSDVVLGVYAVGSTVYAATGNGLSISTDGGNSFTSYTTANGLGSNAVYGVYAVGSTVYAATGGGLSLSTDGGNSFTNKTTINGLGSNGVYEVYTVGSTVYAATSFGGLSISTDGGNSFTNYTTANGLGNNDVYGVYAVGSTVYAATTEGVSFCAPACSPPTLSISATPALTITQGQSATLTAQGAATYYWSTAETTPSIQVSTAGPYSVTGTSANGCTAAASVTLTVMPTFAITGVTTLACTPVSPNRFSLSFDPRYQGLNGQPLSFSVTNELLPTTQPGPYTLQLYTDNPIITLVVIQSGVATRFTYHWLEACNASTTPNTPPRVAMGIPAQTATVGQYFSYVIPNGTFTDDQTPSSLQLSARGLPPGLSFAGATLSGSPASTVGSPFSLTITATDPGGLTASTTLLLTVQPASGTPPPPTGAFSITGVSTISCTPVANRISIVYQPRYGGANGQPIAFDVVNESLPTTEPGPYSLTLYRDNPVITLRASQTGSGGPVTFSYNWLSACQPGARPAARPEVPLSVVVLGNPVAGETVEVEVRGAQGQSVQLRIVDLKGQLVSERQVEQAGLVERQVLELRGHAGSHLLLQVSSGEQIHTLKLIRR